jgi:hypothetical protein
MGKRLIILLSPVGLPSTNPFIHDFISLYGTYYCRRDRRMYRRSLAIVTRLSHLMYDPRHKSFCTILFRNGFSPSIFHLLLSHFTRIRRRSFGTIRCAYFYSDNFFSTLINFRIFYFFILITYVLPVRYPTGSLFSLHRSDSPVLFLSHMSLPPSTVRSTAGSIAVCAAIL